MSRRNVRRVTRVERKQTTDQNATQPLAKFFASSVKKVRSRGGQEELEGEGEGEGEGVGSGRTTVVSVGSGVT